MKIKSIKNFRWHYKTHVRKRKDRNTNTNFLGVYHDEGNKRTNGYFELTHGDKKIHKFLPSILKIAEDGQAIYEFIQNAVDCDSSQFFVFYNDKYFLAVNNGKPFNHKDVLSILNIADTTKDDNCENIGRFGIGFKLVHRLVGKDEGIKELIEDYKGPIIYSWNDIGELKQLLGNSPVFPNFVKNPANLDDIKSPWLFKIIATNFPTEPGEKVLDINYNEKVLFPYSELKEIIEFLKENLKKHQGIFDFENLEQGSLFFLKLGEGKRKLLDEDYIGLKNGVQYSMNFLKNLEEVYINDNSLKKRDLKIKTFIIRKGSQAFIEINPEYANCDIKIALGYTDYKNSTGIRKSPNFYKYFPMGDETNNFSFILHCDGFDIESNRRKLHDSNKNRKLFPKISDFITQYADEQKEKNRDEFLNLYANILMSKIPDKENNKWLYEIFFKNLLSYIQTNIPVKDGYSDNAQNVKVNKLKIQLNLSDFGLNHIKWFFWENEESEELLNEVAKPEKLGITAWDIRDIVENAEIKSINNWIETCDKKTYNFFLKELEESYLREETKEHICQIKFFKFSDDKYYSINNIISSKDEFGKTSFNNNNYFFKNEKTNNIKQELNNLGIFISEISVADYPNIFSSTTFPEDKKRYNIISEKCKLNTLTSHEKKNLFLNLINDKTKFDNIAEGILMNDLHLFCDSTSEIKPLNRLIDCNLNTESWLNAYKIKKNDFFTELKPFLIIEEEAIFKNIFLPNEDLIISNLTEDTEIKSLIKLYKNNQEQFFKDFIIKKTEHSFSIVKKLQEKIRGVKGVYQVYSADPIARKFIESGTNNLFILPSDFSAYKEDEGIVKFNNLHSLILDLVDVDENREILVDIVKYTARKKFLQNLSEFRFSSEKKYTKNDYEFKILDLACTELEEADYPKFKNKVVIETENQEIKLSDIPPFTDKIKILKKEFSLSKLLPSTYQNSNLISDLIKMFEKLGIFNEKLNKLFGVNEEININNIYKKFSQEYETLENPEQFFFLIYYHKHIANIDLSKLGFDFTCAIFPSEYALETEKLPEYLQVWIKNKKIKLSELEEIGIWTGKTVIVELRKYWSGKIKKFQKNRISQEIRFNNEEKILFNTFEWMKENELELSTGEQFDTFKKVVEIINTNRKEQIPKKGELIIIEKKDLKLLNEHSEKWESTEYHTIFLYDGEMPIIVELDEIADYNFFRYSKGDYVVTQDNIIYINSNTNQKKTLQKVASSEDNNFSFKELWTLFDEFSNREKELIKENSQLKKQIAESTGATLGTESSGDISKNDQKEANREAKEIVKEKLESEGFEFTQGIDNYSTINGVTKDGIEFPLVVKSYKYQDEPLKIGANEWIQLMKPNSMFWVHFGNRKLGCLKLYELLRNEEKLSISFSTENLDKEDRLDNFAELLNYFSNVHFDFNSVKPYGFSVGNDLKNYRFDERKNEEDLSGDDKNLL